MAFFSIRLVDELRKLAAGKETKVPVDVLAALAADVLQGRRSK
jgi:hypothetical protein